MSLTIRRLDSAYKVAATATPGCVHADPAGYTADKLGRKRTIQLGSAIAIVGCAIQTGALNVGALIAGRFIAGWSIGVLSCIVPMYQVRILSTRFWAPSVDLTGGMNAKNHERCQI